MIKTKNQLLTFILTVSVIVLACGGSGGGGDDDPMLTDEQIRLRALAGTTGITWTATSITFDGAPADGFDNFSLTIRGTDNTAKTYTSIDGDPLFDASGTWAFNGTNINQLIFDGESDNVYSISNIDADATPATLTLTVNFTNPGSSAAGTNGTYVLNMQAQ